MIETFKDKKIENFLKRGNAQGIPPNFLKKIKLRLDVIDAATHIEQIRACHQLSQIIEAAR